MRTYPSRRGCTARYTVRNASSSPSCAASTAAVSSASSPSKVPNPFTVLYVWRKSARYGFQAPLVHELYNEQPTLRGARCDTKRTCGADRGTGLSHESVTDGDRGLSCGGWRPRSSSPARRFGQCSRHPFGSLPGEILKWVRHSPPRVDSVAGHPRHAPRSPPLSSHLPAQATGCTSPGAAPPGPRPGEKSRGRSDPSHGSGLARFNTLSPEAAHAVLLHCCGSRRWAHRMATHRPYPDSGSLLAAADEASYDLSQADLTEALASECPEELGHGAPYAALLALDAAHAEYERKFGHAFVICLDGHPPEEQADQLLAAIRRRMGHEEDEERSISADELRRVAQARLLDLTRWLTSADGLSATEIGLYAPVG
ncbi:2-oxo-4-hydroxy-4-carboxy-5-ureidoimidazoline decarboxylase [Streptomyces xanthophaeus]|uniref:2-oxo-4-hydroxy-4-carboxy-5-ureidoimidazoline decarboxylase n=1 Tax=Streptomyces xanthophaeus TaxID=67385 RepID=UPI0039875AE9